jgi:predicted nuclease of predicted toxin-antitoxin system
MMRLHVHDLGLATADDEAILSRALRDGRIVVSRDGDFATLLARANATGPSFVHLRIPGVNKPADQLALLDRALKLAAAELATGAIVTVRRDRVRIRSLPVHVG